MQCSACGEEIRFGYRDGQEAYWHREPVDHAPIHGHRMAFATQEEIRRQREEVVRHMDDGTPYTTAEWEISKDKDLARRKRRLAELRGEEEAEVVIPEPEVARHDLDPTSFAPTSGIAQVVNLVTGVTRRMPSGKSSKSKKHPPMAPGWELRRLTGARGPYLGADGTILSVSDTVVLGARGPEVDGGVAIAVASWRDGDFDTAYVGRLKDGVVKVEPVNATELKAWIKEPA